ncbi:MAG: segregation/condensation protein A [Clostridiales Family XIII bacterium]|jgi:segregation and condensation protein A|nr:segregation/condensation protein A [Clostridiales Family XIII bacterium]
MAYKVRLDNFEGPFDLLVYLIENAEMSIYDIQVAEITRQYIAHVEAMQSRDLALSGEFMVLAAVLIEIKSKMLLPRAKAGEGEAGADPRQELAQKLLEYRKYRAAAERLSEREELAGLVIEKPQEDLLPYTGEPDEYLRMDPARFAQAFRAFLSRKQRIDEVRRVYARVERQRATVESRILFIERLFRQKRVRSLRFGELIGEGGRFEVVLTFISLLEMIRSKCVRAVQKGSFAEITLELCGKGETADVQQEGREVGL